MQKIIINNKEYTMPGISVDTYMNYLELAEQTEERKRYKKQDIEAMALFLCRAYGNQFTYEELTDPETGLDAAGIILEFQFIDVNVAKELEKRMNNIEKNIQGCM